MSNGSPVVFAAAGLGARDRLIADPDLAAVLADMDRAVHRLHCRVREERNLVGRVDLGGGARHGLVDIADVLRDRPRIERRLLELGRDVVRAELGVRTVVPFDLERREPFLRRPHMIGHDRDGVVEPHDLAHALDGLGGRIIDALHAAAEHGRLRERRDLHARRPNVDAKNGRAVDLRRRVQTLGRRADELEILRSLERDAFRDRHAGGVGGKLAIFEPFFPSARESPRRSARGRTPDRHSSASPPPTRAWSSRSRRLRAAASMPRVSQFESPVACTPASRGFPYSFSLGGACSSRTCFRSTSSSSAISIGMAV